MGILSRLTGKPTQDEFADLVAQELRNAGESESVQYDSEDFSLSLGDKSLELKLNLETLYREYCSAPKKERPDRLASMARTWFEAKATMPETFEEAVDSLLPRVRERAYWHINELVLESEGRPSEPVPYLALNDFLGVGLVHDRPSSMQNVSSSDLNRWGIDLNSALDAATENLRAGSMEEFSQVSPGIWASPWQDNYDTSRILLTERFHQLDLKGSPVISIPTRDHLLVCGSDDHDGLAGLASMTLQALEDPRVVYGIPMLLEQEKLLPFLPSKDHPVYSEIKMLWLQSQVRDYEEQKILLDKIHEDRQIDIFVATTKGMRSPEGELHTMCVLTKGVDTLLPQTDSVGLVVVEVDSFVMVSWSDLVEVAGELLEKTDYYPIRYSVRGFPGDEQLEKLRARS